MRTIEKISREEALRKMAACRLALCSESEIKSEIDNWLDEPLGDRSPTQDDLYAWLAYEYQGASNGFLSLIYMAMTGASVEVCGDVAELYKCPCCGFRTLRELSDYGICPHCFWEDTGPVQDIHTRQSPNRGSVADYREHIRLNQNYYHQLKWLT